MSRGHKFTLHLGGNVKAILSRIKNENFDLLGFSCMTGMQHEVLKIAEEIKKNTDIPIIMGGVHPTFFPDVLHKNGIDIICRGEGEFPLIELLDALEKKQSYLNIPNLWTKQDGVIHKNDLRPLIEPLDTIPLIDWSCYEGTVVQQACPVVFPIRGCPSSCSYCFNDAFRKLSRCRPEKYIRHFSVERVIKEVKAAIRIFSHEPVFFASDTFGIDLEWTDRMLSSYSKITDLPFIILLVPGLATEKLITIISNYKCQLVIIGVESGSKRLRRDILNRHYSNDMLITISEMLHKAGIKFRTFNMVGIPTETEDDIWETIDLNIRMKTDFPRSAILMPMPGTKMVEIAKAKGYLNQDFSVDDIPASVLTVSILKNVDTDRIQNTHYFFQTAVLFPKLRNIIKKLIRLKPNVFFRIWFWCMYLYQNKKCEGRGFISYATFLFANRKYK